jgi:hypothetical protein
LSNGVIERRYEHRVDPFGNVVRDFISPGLEARPFGAGPDDAADRLATDR